MVDDYPMNDEVDRDAEMGDYDGYYDDAAMADESGGVNTQLKEYDMEGDIEAEYEEPMMVAEPADGMVTEQPPPAVAPVADIPIMEEPVAAPSPADVPILPATSTTAVPQPLLTPPQPTPHHVSTELPIATFSNPSAEVPAILGPITPVVETAVNPIATSITSEPQNPNPPPETATTAPTNETKTVPEAQVEGASELKESAHVLPTAPIEPSQDQGTTVAAVEAPVEPEKSALPPQAVEEAAEPLVENGPTVIVPHITLYYNEQAFVLFAPSETEDTSPSLLSGQPELFVAPLDQLLRALRLQETQHFASGEDFVLGLEYPDLDLCIDENSKHATKYTLQDFCDALVACNHTNIMLTLYQVTDFAYSLKQRLEGIIPEFPQVEDDTHPQPSIDDPAVQAEVQVHIPDTLPVQPDHVEAPPSSVPHSSPQSAAPEDHSSQKEPPGILAPEVESVHDQDDNRITGPSESGPEPVGVVVTEAPVEVPATELPPEVEENDEVDAHEDDYSAEAFDDEDLGEPVPPDDTLTSSNGMSGRAVEGTVDESAGSSATLESSVHGEVEPEYIPEDDQPEDQQDEAQENSQAEPVTADAIDGHVASEETSPLESNEPIESQSQANSQEVDEEAIEHDELDDSEAHELPLDKTGETSAQEGRQSAAPETSSSPGTSEYEEYEGYEEYEEAEGQDESTAHPDEETTHDALLAGPEHGASGNDPAKTPPVSNVTRITPPGKRTLGERDAEDEYEYGIDDLYESDAKRARVE